MATYQEFKIVLLGRPGVGKSTFVIRYISDHFAVDFDPTIEESYRKQVIVDDENSLLDILDTCEYDEEYKVLRDTSLRSGQGFILMYSITSRESFDSLTEFHTAVTDIKLKIMEDNTPLIIIGTKCDLDSERQVSKEEGEEFANMLECPFFEASSKDRINIDEPMCQLVRLIRNKNMIICK